MAVPFLQSLRASLDGDLWAVGKSKAIQLYNGNDFFNRFIPFDRKGFTSFVDLIASVKSPGFERAIALPHSFRSALLFYVAQIEERIGYARNKRGFMLTCHVPEKVRPEPTVEHYLKIIDVMGGRRVLETPVLSVTAEEEERFDENHLDMRRPYVVFITGAQYGPSKCWPGSHFSELADLITGDGATNVYIFPGAGEEKFANKIREGAKRKERVAVKSLGIGDLKVGLSRAAVVVTNDTGPRHISAALSVPTVVLLGPMDERYTYYPSRFTYPMVKEAPCRPCNKKKCDRDHICLKSITPAEVFTRLGEIFGHNHRSAH